MGELVTENRFDFVVVERVKQPCRRADDPRLYNILENLCISRGFPMPKLKVMDSDSLNAFATGMNAKQYSITVRSFPRGRKCREECGWRWISRPPVSASISLDENNKQ